MAELLSLGINEAMRELGPSRGKRTVMNPQNQPALLGGAAGGFQSARIDRLTKDWSTTRRSADQELFNGLVRLRARARERALNSPIGSKFLQMLRTNVVGAHGIKLEFKVEKQRQRDGAEIYDDDVNEKLSKAWKKWCKRKYCTMQGNLSFQDVCNLWCDAIGRDGDFLVRGIAVPSTENPFGFALQLLDADQLNENINVVGGPDKNQVRMGVEVDRYQRPLAYHLYDGNPVEFGFGSANCRRVPAETVFHSYIPRRIGQSRGYPLLAPVLWDVNQLDKYFDAELTAARTGASLLGAIEQDADGGAYEGDGENLDGTAKVSVEAGTLVVLGPNQKLNNQTPEHPTAAFNPFVERSLRLIASGLGVAYHELGNDLASVNFSSGRLGRQESIDYWMELQRMLIESVVRPVFEMWLRMALLSGAIDLPFTPDRYSDDDALEFIPRRWDYVDPLKDVQSDIDSIQNGIDTHENVLRKRGKDYRKVFKQLKVEQDLADELGLQLGTDIRGDALSEINDGEPDDTGQPGKPGTPPESAPPSSKPKSKKQLAHEEMRRRRSVLMFQDS